MNTTVKQSDHHDDRETPPADLQAEAKRPFPEPKLTFVEPALTRHGDLKDVTMGFLGSFSP